MTEATDTAKLLWTVVLLAIGFVSITQPVSAQAWENPEWISPAAEAPGLSQRTFHSEAVGTPVSYHIYTPPEYDAEGDRRFPVLYWLHGSAGGEGAVPNLTRLLDAAMREGKMPPILVVYPNGLELSFWLNSKDGRVPMETVVMAELVPRIDANYRSIASREGRVVEGFSMGGYGAARLGFKFHDVFGTVSILAGGPLQREYTHAPRATEERRQMVLENIYGGATTPTSLIRAPGYSPRRMPMRCEGGRAFVWSSGSRTRWSTSSGDFTSICFSLGFLTTSSSYRASDTGWDPRLVRWVITFGLSTVRRDSRTRGDATA